MKSEKSKERTEVNYKEYLEIFVNILPFILFVFGFISFTISAFVVSDVLGLIVLGITFIVISLILDRYLKGGKK